MKEKKRLWKRWWFWVVIVVIIIAASQGADETPKKVADSTTTEDTTKEKEEKEETESEKTESEKTESEKTESEKTEPEKTEFTKGEVVELKNVKTTLVDVIESEGSEFNKPNDGKVFVLAEFLIENESEKDVNISSLMSFECYVDGFSSLLDFGALLEKQEGNQLDGTIAPGKKMKGYVGYQVPKDWKELEIQFDPSFSNNPITFIIKK